MWFHPQEASRIGKSVDGDEWSPGAGEGGWVMLGVLGDDGNALELGRGSGHTAVGVCPMPLNCSFERGQLFFFSFTEVLIYNVVLISAVHQSDSVVRTYTFFFYVLSHDGLSQDTEYSSLCYTIGSFHPSIPYIIECFH